MKKHVLFFLSLAAITTLYSCNKDDVSKSFGSEQPKTDNTDKVIGQFTSRYVFYDATYPSFPGFASTQEAEARFMRTRQQGVLVLADTASVNSLMMQNDPANFHTLTDQIDPNLNMKDSCIWRVRSTSVPEIPSFDFSFRAPFPVVNAKFPDTISKTQNLTFSIHVAGADSLVIGINGDSSNFDGYLYKSFIPNQNGNNYTFSVKDYSKIRRSDYFGAKQAIKIIAYSKAIQDIKGNYMTFMKETTFYGGIWINQK